MFGISLRGRVVVCRCVHYSIEFVAHNIGYISGVCEERYAFEPAVFSSTRIYMMSL